MSALPKKKRFTYEEYLALEARSQERHEYYNGVIIAMPGMTGMHARICASINRRIDERLDGTPCCTFDGNLKVRIPSMGLTVYPDLSVVCGEPHYEGDKQLVLLNPRVVVEIASPSTENHDRTVKARYYREIESLHEIVLVAQDEARIETYFRGPDNSWKHEFHIGLETTLILQSLNISIPLAAIYDRIVFPEPVSPYDE